MKPTLKPTPKSSSKSKPTHTPTKAVPSNTKTPQIRAAFDSYAIASHISTDDISRALRALNYPLPPADFFDAEQEEEGLGFEEFRELAETLASTMEDSDGHSDAEPDADAFDDDGGEGEGEGDGDEEDEANAELAEAFNLFTQFQPQYANLKAADRRITMADLARIAKELKEDVGEEVLRMMIEEANGEAGTGAASWKRGVSLGEFREVMRRAGAVG